MWKFVASFCLLTTLASSNIDVAEEPLTLTVSVLKNERPICLGVIVDKKYVATSAHCVSGGPVSSLSIKTFQKGGSSKTEIVSKVQRVIVHPYYTNLDYDIALLKINPLDTVTAGLELGKTEPLPKNEVHTIYWNPQNTNESSPRLEPVSIVDRKSCREKIGKVVSGRMICAYDNNPSLRSDGPLISNGTLIGIPSKRFESDKEVLPAIYTNIANTEIYSFIESYV